MSITLYKVLELKKQGLENQYAELNAIYKKQWIKRRIIKEKLNDLSSRIAAIEDVMLMIKDGRSEI